LRICEECINATYLKQDGEERLRIAIVTSRGGVNPCWALSRYTFLKIILEKGYRLPTEEPWRYEPT